MELLFNELSIHGQFEDVQTFSTAIEKLMEIRIVAKKYNRELYCHRNCQNAVVIKKIPLNKAIQQLDRNKVRAVMGWLGQTGPYWEDGRLHSDNEYYECQQKIVTDTAIGECAFLLFSNREAQLVSMVKSDWGNSPLKVDWHTDNLEPKSIELTNHLSEFTLEAQLQLANPPLQSWDQLEQMCSMRFENLHFSKETFKPLQGRPFVAVAAKSFMDLLDVLSRFKASHQSGERRTSEGNELYQEFFTGEFAWFTDSSDTEKEEFKKKMTFPHPEKLGEEIFAPFHGKVKTPQMRVHFSWPVSADKPIYILYIGDKITKT
jgi:hypothetical protein